MPEFIYFIYKDKTLNNVIRRGAEFSAYGKTEGVIMKNFNLQMKTFFYCHILVVI